MRTAEVRQGFLSPSLGSDTLSGGTAGPWRQGLLPALEVQAGAFQSSARASCPVCGDVPMRLDPGKG